MLVLTLKLTPPAREGSDRLFFYFRDEHPAVVVRLVEVSHGNRAVVEVTGGGGAYRVKLYDGDNPQSLPGLPLVRLAVRDVRGRCARVVLDLPADRKAVTVERGSMVQKV